MPGNHKQHLEEFGMCRCNGRTDTEMLNLEYQEELTGRWKTEKVPACAECWGLKG